MKTHFAEVDRANESYNHDEWGTTLCGLDNTESPLSNKIAEVTCKKCINRYPAYLTEMEVCIQHQIKEYEMFNRINF